MLVMALVRCTILLIFFIVQVFELCNMLFHGVGVVFPAIGMGLLEVAGGGGFAEFFVVDGVCVVGLVGAAALEGVGGGEWKGAVLRGVSVGGVLESIEVVSGEVVVWLAHVAASRSLIWPVAPIGRVFSAAPRMQTDDDSKTHPPDWSR